MAGSYSGIIARTSGQADALVPEPLATSIIEELPKQSAALALMQRTMLSSKTQRIPVLDVLPVSYWVSGDTGMKQTTYQAWKNVVLVVEELATIVPIPQAYLDDADMPIWSQVQPRMVESAGALIDTAVLWGTNKPATWGEAVFTGAKKVLQVQKAGTAVDYAADISALAQKIVQTGYTVKGFAAMPGLSWKLVGIRSAQGVPIYEPDLQGGDGSAPGRLYGYPATEVDNGSWNASATGAELLMGDFSKAMIGVRQDISFKMFTEGVVSNDSGKVILNLMQQDAVAMRMVMRLAYATVNPVTILSPGSSITARWPFGAVLPTTATAPTTAQALSQMTSYATAGAYTPFDPTTELAGVSDEAAIADVQARHAALQAQSQQYEEFLKSKGAAPAELPSDSGTGRSGGRSSGKST
jgi:HK97 family phage major capsid protein